MSAHEACANSELEFRLWTFTAHDVTWDFGDGTASIDGFASKAYTANGTYYVTANLRLTCGADTTLYDTIVIKDNPPFMWDTQLDFEDDICPNQEVTIDLLNWEREGDTRWDLGDGSPAQVNDWYNIQHTYTTAGAYPLSAVVVDACGTRDTILDTIHIVQKTSMDPNIYLSTYVDSVCPGAKVEPYLMFSGINDSTYWTTSDGQIAWGSPISFTFPTEGLYTISARAKDGCGNDTTVSTSVVVANTGQFMGYLYLDVPDSICPGDAFSVWADGDLASATFDFGDGTTRAYTGSDIDHKYQAPGTYQVQLIGTDLCGNSDTLTEQVVVTHNLARFYLETELPDSVCPSDEFILYFDANTDSVVWDLGDGTQKDAHYFLVHSYATQGWKQLSLTATNGCGKTQVIKDSIYVGTNVSADASWIDISHLEDVCLGDSMSFTSFPYASSVKGFFGDGNSGTLNKVRVNAIDQDFTLNVGVATHLYSSMGTYTPFFVLTNGCGNSDTTYTSAVHVSNSSNIDVEVSTLSFEDDLAPVCVDTEIDFIFEGASKYEISYGDGKSETIYAGDLLIKSHSYSSPGVYKVQFTGSNSCGDMDSAEVEVEVKACGSSSTQELEQLRTNVFPNPSSGMVNLVIEENAAFSFQVFNLQGVLVNAGIGQGQVSLDLGGLSNGTYLVQLTHQGQQAFHRIMILH